MKFHPALLMLMVWSFAFGALVILPFEFTHRSIELYGLFVLCLFVAVFCLGGLLRTVHLPQRHVSDPSILRTKRADFLLKTVCTIALLTMGLEVMHGVASDLGLAYSARSGQAQALLHGGASQSSNIFKIGFICYPASYVFLARSLLFDAKPRWWQIIIFGVLPGILASLVMGGRAPMFNTMAYGFLAYTARGVLFGKRKREIALKPPKVRNVHPLIKVAAIIGSVFAFKYFINVFIIRAEVVGGPEAMLKIAASRWGVTFGGPLAEAMIAFLGPATTYLIFVFVWYLIQGAVISNSLFMSYQSEPMMGVYGIELLTAVVRRIDPAGVSQGFNYLLNLDTYGFLPSAFGTLYVDFLFGGLIIAFVWGWLCGVVYRNIRCGTDPRWFIFSPFITLGIIFSLVNTPLSFSNGFVTHFWLVLIFLLIRRPQVIERKE